MDNLEINQPLDNEPKNNGSLFKVMLFLGIFGYILYLILNSTYSGHNIKNSPFLLFYLNPANTMFIFSLLIIISSIGLMSRKHKNKFTNLIFKIILIFLLIFGLFTFGTGLLFLGWR